MSVLSRPLSYGEKAVGITFNPGGNTQVVAIKAAYAAVIDQLNNARTALKGDPAADRDHLDHSEQIRLFSVAITEAQTAQMWAVKAVTWST